MRSRWLAGPLCFGFLLGACNAIHPEGAPVNPEIREVTLPDGFLVQAEVEVKPEDMQRGMMFRDSLQKGKGMLFVHQEPGKYPYWMANCKFALDIIWMNGEHHVVEISADTPPCPAGGEQCPNFGGHAAAQFVLELGGGEAARHSIKEGSTIRF